MLPVTPGPRRCGSFPRFVDYPYRAQGTVEDWRREIGRWCFGDQALIMATQIPFAAPFLDRFGMGAGAIHLVGESEKREAMLRLAASVVGDAIFDADSQTLMRLGELAAPRHRGVLVLRGLGDLTAPAEAAAAIERLCHRRDSKLLVISAGEMPIHRAGRINVIDLDAMGFGEHLRPGIASSIEDAAGRFYGAAFAAFLARLDGQDPATEAALAELKRAMEGLVQQVEEKEPSGSASEERLLRRCALWLTVSELVEQWRFNVRSQARSVFDASDKARNRFYDELRKRGAPGRLALNLFKAQHASNAAKEAYGGPIGTVGGMWRDRQYEKKDEALRRVTEVLAESADRLDIPWGWGPDYYRSERYPWVLYVDLPTGQASFHARERSAGPRYAGGWDGGRPSEERIKTFFDMVYGMPVERLLDED